MIIDFFFGKKRNNEKGKIFCSSAESNNIRRPEDIKKKFDHINHVIDDVQSPINKKKKLCMCLGHQKQKKKKENLKLVNLY